MANTAPAVKIPLQLELDAVQGQLNSLKKTLKDSVNVDTSAYKTLAGILAKAEKYFLQISVASKEAFTSQSDIEKFKKSFQSLTNEINLFGAKFETLNFKELGLKDTDEIKDKIKEIENLKEQIDSIKKHKIGKLLGGDEAEDIRDVAKEFKINFGKDIKVEDFKKSFDKVENNLIERVKELELTLEDTAETISFKGTLDEIATRLKQQFENNDTTEEAFKSFKEELKEELPNIFEGLDFNGAVGELFKSTKPITSVPFIDQLIEAIKKDKAEIEETYQTVTDSVAEAQSNLNKVQSASGKANKIFEQADLITVQQLQQKIQDLTNEIDELRAVMVLQAKEAQNCGKAGKNMGNILSSVTPKISAQARELRELQEAQERIGNIKSAIKNWLGFSEVVNITKNALRDAFNNIKELDATMTQIAVVTDMSQSELWDQVSTYSAIAKQYGATTQGVYEVSQLYYQQGLDTASVMELTTETLKLATIANVDYADATDYMTVAIRGFKMEMSDAQNVVDVYSNLAAVTASDVEELAVAMSKTASSAEAVGSSFENTSAMIALMVNFLPLIIEKLY